MMCTINVPERDLSYLSVCLALQSAMKNIEQRKFNK